MDAVQEARRKEMLDQILAMAKKMASELEACREVFRAAPPAFVADFDHSECEVDITTGNGYHSDDLAPAPSPPPPAPPAPSPTSAPDQDADHSFQFGETKLSPTSPTRCSTHGSYQGAHVPVFGNSDHRDSEVPNSSSNDGGDVDRLSGLPDLLLRDIVARLPIKDAGRTAVLSRRWSPLWSRRAAPLVVDHADLAVFCLDSDRRYGLEPWSPDGLLEQIRQQQEGHARPFLANHDPAAYTTARAWRPPWFHASRSIPSRRCCSPSRKPTLELLIRPYDPGAGFAGGARVGVYFDTGKAEHARVQTFAMGLFRCSARTWPADLRTGVGIILNTVDTVNIDPTFIGTGYNSDDSVHGGCVLAFRPVDLVPAQDLARKVTANLFVVQHGARIIYNADARNAVLGQEATPAFQFGTTEFLCASPTICSTLGLYNIAGVPVSVSKSFASPPALLVWIPLHNITPDIQITWSKHLQTTHASKALEIMFLASDDLQTTDMLRSHLLDIFMASSNPASSSNIRLQQGRCSLGTYFKYKLATCMLISIIPFLQHGQNKRSKPPWKEGSKCRSFQSSGPHKLLKWFSLSQCDLMLNGFCLHHLVEDGHIPVLIFLPGHQLLTFYILEIISLDDLAMSASPLWHAPPVAIYFLESFMVLPMQVKLKPWPPQPVIVTAGHHQLELTSQREIDGHSVQIKNCTMRIQCTISSQLDTSSSFSGETSLDASFIKYTDGVLTSGWKIQRTLLKCGTEGNFKSSSEQATHIQCWTNIFQFQKFQVWLHQKWIVVLWISIIKDWQVILWDPGGATPLTIRLVVFLLQPCSPCRWYKNPNGCCITDSSNFWSGWVPIPCENIGSKRSCFLNASMEQMLLQENEARVQACYDWCHGRFILSIMSVRVTWDPGGSKLVKCFAATAWGQAVFQEGEYVTYLLIYQLVDWMKKWIGLVVGCWAGLWLGRLRRPATRRSTKGTGTPSRRVSKDQNLNRTGGCELCSSRGESAYSSYHSYPTPSSTVMYRSRSF